ncbi:MAG: methyltransferase domain-containing protein [Actinomycetota bacterium]
MTASLPVGLPEQRSDPAGDVAVGAWVRRPRHAKSTPPLDAAELEWWEQYADVEDYYCWVQTPAIRRFLRGRYIDQLRQSVPPDARVLEIGCGTGWLARELAQSGAAEVHGVEFSRDQIARARKQTEGIAGGDRVHFHVMESSLSELPGLLSGKFDVLVLHAVLHHLSDSELRALVQLFRERLAEPGARALILEPVLFRGPDSPRTWQDRLADRLILLPRLGRRTGVRKLSQREASLQTRIDSRGDSPRAVFWFATAGGLELFTLDSVLQEEQLPSASGALSMSCTIPELPLAPGSYTVSVAFGDTARFQEQVERALTFEVLPADFFGVGKLPPRERSSFLLRSRWAAQS